MRPFYSFLISLAFFLPADARTGPGFDSELDLRNADEMLALVRTNSSDSGRLAMLEVMLP